MTEQKTICTTCLRLREGLCDGEKEQMACPSYKQMTNGDRIRAMTDEEMALMIYEVSWRIAQDPDYIDTEQDWLDWLKQEVSENG